MEVILNVPNNKPLISLSGEHRVYVFSELFFRATWFFLVRPKHMNYSEVLVGNTGHVCLLALGSTEQFARNESLGIIYVKLKT